MFEKEGNHTHRTGRAVTWLEKRINLTEMFSLLSIFGLFYTEVDTQKPLIPALREALAKPMPSYSRWPRVLGLVCLILFGWEVITGFLLAFYYRPSPQEAYDSVMLIVRDANFGWFMRQMHWWGAQLLIVLLGVRLIRFFFSGFYRPPRELGWMAGVMLLLVATHLEFSGQFLSWTNAGYWSNQRGAELLLSIPLVGGVFSFLIGGAQLDGGMLHRFYFLHVLVLPALFWMLLYVSFSTVRRVGLSTRAGEEMRGGGRAYLAHLINLLLLLFLIFGVLVTLSVLSPVPLGEPADPFKTPVGTLLPWYLWAPYGFIEMLPHWLSLSIRSGLLFLVQIGFVLLPLLVARFPSSRTMNRVLGGGFLLLWVVLTVYGYSIDLPV